MTPYTVRRSGRARRVRVTVHPDGAVEVVLPSRAPAGAADEAVVELAGWIERRRAAALRARAEADVDRTPGTVSYLGDELFLRMDPRRDRVHRRGPVLHVPVRDTGAALERWYRRQARLEIAPRLDAACARAGVTYTRLSIRSQRTRWASCSANGAMSFNWRLLLAPPSVLDYVVEHEVAHLTHMDHSPRFWALLESRVPDWRDHARWLRRYGSTLTLDSALRNAA